MKFINKKYYNTIHKDNLNHINKSSKYIITQKNIDKV